MGKKGVTLIEMVSIIVVLGLSIPVLLTMWADVAWRSSRSEVIADAIFYSQQLMEEIKSKRFDRETFSPWTDSGNLGVDTGDGEVAADKNTFDDVDDFLTVATEVGQIVCTDTSVTTPATGYIRSVKVEYGYLDASSDWQACATPITCVTETNCSNCNQCCYKRIIVSVSRADNLVKDVSLVTIVGGLK